MFPDTTFHIPEAEGSILDLVPSPDGRAGLSVGWNASRDTVLVNRASLVDGRSRRLAAWAGSTVEAFLNYHPPRAFWLTDGTLIVSIWQKKGSTFVWHRIPANGGRPVPLGSPPWASATHYSVSMSADGRRVVANVGDEQSDVYVIRNFAELLRR